MRWNKNKMRSTAEFRHRKAGCHFFFDAQDRQLRRCIEKKVNHTGVYQSQHRLLMHLNHHPNCSQIEIAREMEISPAAVAVSLKKLESGGYIMRETTESDSRTHRVTITKKGRSVIERSEQMFWETEKAMFEGFSEEEMQSLQQFLERIYENLLRNQQPLLRRKQLHPQRALLLHSLQ